MTINAHEARRMAQTIARMEKRLRDLERAPRLANSSIDDGNLPVLDADGTTRQIIGAQPDGTYTVTDLNGPPPPQPVAPTVTARAGVLVVTHDGTYVDGASSPADFAYFEVHVGTAAGFAPTDATQVATWPNRRGGEVTLAQPALERWVTVVAVSTSRTESTPSDYTAGTALIPSTGSDGVATYVAATPPLGLGPEARGAVWWDTSRGNLPHRWDGSQWVPLALGIDAFDTYTSERIADAFTRADAALTEAQRAAAVADGAIRTYYQEDPPWPEGSTQPDSSTGDLWFRTSDSVAFRWTGTTWAVIEDTAVSTALAEARTARAVADGKITAYYQPDPPAVAELDDLWFETDNGNRAHRCTTAGVAGGATASWAPVLTGLAGLDGTVTARALGAITTYYQAAAPALSSSREGDLWIDTDDGQKLYRRTATAWVPTDDARLQQALTAAGNAQATADGKMRVFTQTTPPTGLGAGDVGDLWIDIDDGNRLYRWDGESWEDARDTTIAAAAAAAATAQARADTAVANAATAQATADGKVVTHFQTSAPTGKLATDDGDLWFDTDDKNRMYRWNGSTMAWVASEDQRIAEAVTAAGDAQTTADSKIVTLYQTAAPAGTGRTTGDLWVDTDDGNRLYRWSGTQWVDIRDTTIAAAASAASAAQTAANNAQSAAQTAQATADGKIDTFYQATAPTSGMRDGDLWFDTDDNKAYRYNGTAWVSVQDTGITAALGAAQNAQTTADGKITSYYQAAAPWADGTSTRDADVGDLWFKTDQGNRTYYWATNRTWTALPTGLAALGADVTARALGAITTYTGTTAPTGVINGDMWLHGPQTLNGVANKYVLKRWNGSAWVEVSDAKVEQAISSATTAANLADAKMRIFYEAKHASGMYPASAPTMVATDVGDLWFRTDEGSRPYRWDGTAWAPFALGLQAADLTPTVAPGASPTPIVMSGSGVVVVRWDATNLELNTVYDLHVTADNTVPVSTATLHTANVRAPVFVALFSQESKQPLPFDGDTYFALVARNSRGSSAPSAWVPGRPGPLAEDALRASLAIVQNVVAELVQTSGLRIGTGEWTAENGFDIPGVVHFPIDGTTDSAQVYARLIAQALSIENYFSLRGTVNQIETGARMALAAGVTDPQSKASVAAWYSSKYVAGATTSVYDGGIARDEAFAAGRWVALDRTAVNGINTNSVLRRFNEDGTSDRAITVGLKGEGGVAYNPDDGFYWVLGTRYTDSNRWYLARIGYNLDTVDLYLVGAATFYDGTYKPTVGPGLIIGVESDGITYRRGFSVSGSTFTLGGRINVNAAVGKRNLAGALITFPPGNTTTRRLIVFPTAANPIVIDTATNGRLTAEEFPKAHTTVVGAATSPYGGSNITTLDENGKQWIYSLMRWNHDLGYSYNDTDTDGTGIHETGLSPITQVNVSAGAFLSVTVPIPPDTGDIDSPDSVRLYMGLRGATQANMPLQMTLARGKGTATLTTYSTTSTVRPRASTFASAEGLSPGRILSIREHGITPTEPAIDLRGDGKWRLDDTKNLDDTGWIALTLANGWANWGGTWPPARVRRIGNRVYLSGLLKAGTTAAGTLIATLPDGFRPAFDMIRSAMTSQVNEATNALTRNTGAASAGTAHNHPMNLGSIAMAINHMPGRLDIMANGSLVFQQTTLTAAGWVSFDDVNPFLTT